MNPAAIQKRAILDGHEISLNTATHKLTVKDPDGNFSIMYGIEPDTGCFEAFSMWLRKKYHVGGSLSRVYRGAR